MSRLHLYAGDAMVHDSLTTRYKMECTSMYTMYGGYDDTDRRLQRVLLIYPSRLSAIDYLLIPFNTYIIFSLLSFASSSPRPLPPRHMAKLLQLSSYLFLTHTHFPPIFFDHSLKKREKIFPFIALLSKSLL